MKYLRMLLLAISLFFIPFSGYLLNVFQQHSSSEINHPAWQQALRYAQTHLSHEGQLLQKADGFVYLKVDDAYIRALFPMLELSKGFYPPPYFRKPDTPGAHISVFYENEHVHPKEIGQYFDFKLKDIQVVHPSRYTSYVILTVEAPELENLRQQYGRSPKLFGYEYHISLARKHFYGSHK